MKRGLLKTEMVVVVVIVLAAIALLIPFALQQRAASRAMTCQDRLQRLSLAVIEYDTKHGNLPGYRQSMGEITVGWVPPLLPLLHASDQQIEALQAQALAALQQNKRGPAQLPTLLCPAQTPSNRTSPLSFVANCGMPDSTQESELPPDWQANGLFFDHLVEPETRRVMTSLNWLTRHDGAETTLLFSENIDAGAWSDADEAKTGFVWTANLDASDNPTSLPDVLRINQERGAGDGSIKFARPSSYHRGGVNVVMASGSARLVNDQIDYLVWQRLMVADGTSVKLAGHDEPAPKPWRLGE